MPTHPASSVSTLGGGRGNLKNASVTFLAPPAERQRSFSNADLSVASTFHLKEYRFLQNGPIFFLAPPAEWQRSFSNADSSVVRFHLKA